MKLAIPLAGVIIAVWLFAHHQDRGTSSEQPRADQSAEIRAAITRAGGGPCPTFTRVFLEWTDGGQQSWHVACSTGRAYQVTIGPKASWVTNCDVREAAGFPCFQRASERR